MDIYRKTVDNSKYIIATYDVSTTATPEDAAWAIAVGQSIGNPNARSNWETKQMVEDHACKILSISNTSKESDKIRRETIAIAYPIENIDLAGDGVSHLLCQLMGGQMDIDIITRCRLMDIEFPDSVYNDHFKGPRYGISGIRDFTGVYDKPLFGGIVKPKIGLTPDKLLEVVREMVEGGVNFIKEDEILSNPNHCPIEDRVPLIMDYLEGKNVIYAVSITADPLEVIRRVVQVYDLGGNAVHINWWAGLGVYKTIRDLDLPMFLFFQKSGDKVITHRSNPFGIEWSVVCKLAAMSGVDFIHAGMWGGYMDTDSEELRRIMTGLINNNVLPSLSCGMTPDLVKPITDRFGVDYMANTGGYIHSYNGGTKAGCLKMREAIDNDD